MLQSQIENKETMKAVNKNKLVSYVNQKKSEQLFIIKTH